MRHAEWTSENLAAATAPSVDHAAAASQTAPRHAALLFEQVSKWYGAVIGVNQVTLELRSGITGLVGANGAGKTTLLRLATGQLRPDIGRVTVLGCESWSWPARRLYGYCPEVDVFYEEMSGLQFVEAMARLHGMRAQCARDRAAAAIERVGMTGRCDRVIRGYSKGMRQRIKLAQALLHDPPLLLLDEPLSGIDPIGRQDFIELFFELANQGKCLLISSHELEELEKLTNHVAIMARGRVAAVGTITQIRDLLDQHPSSIRIDTAEPRKLAALLLKFDDVIGVDFSAAGRRDGATASIVARVHNPKKFFRDFGRLVLDHDLDILRLETLDESTHAILSYLLGGTRRGT